MGEREEEYTEEEQSEGVRNLRNTLRERERQMREMEDQLNEVRQSQRLQSVQEAFQQSNLPPQAANLYPADAEVSPDAVSKWAEEHGFAAQQPSNPGPSEEVRQSLDRYGRVVQQSFGAPPEQSELDQLRDDLLNDMTAIRDMETVPKPEDVEKARTLARRVNHLNANTEQQVNAGRIERPPGGIAQFGGRFDPPPYAQRWKEAGSF